MCSSSEEKKAAMTKLARRGRAELVGTFEHDSLDWHAQRATVVGSSDVAAILGLSPYKSAYTLWHEKRGDIAPEAPDTKTQRKFDYGHFMEPFVAGLWEQSHGQRLEVTGSWRSREFPWQGCNPDRLLLGHDSLVELKTFPYAEDWAVEPPAGYVAQVKWQLDVFGFHGGWISGYANVSGDYIEHEIYLNEFEAAITRDAVLSFLNSDEPPDIDGSESTYNTLRRLNPSIDRGTQAEIPARIAEMYLEAAATEKVATAELLRWKGHLLAHMGTAQWAVYEGQRIASRVAQRAGAVPYLKEA